MMPTWTHRLAGVAAGLFAVAGELAAQEPKVTPLMTRGLPEVPGKEVLVITVEYAPCWSDPVHRHNAHGWIPASLHHASYLSDRPARDPSAPGVRAV